MTCLRSVDRCQRLKCDSDEGCYLSQQPNGASVVVTLVCAKKDPCRLITCQSDRCVHVYIANQPPGGQCKPFMLSSQCTAKCCPVGTRCLARDALCAGYPCIREGVCVDNKDCVGCNVFTEHFEIIVKNTLVNATCASIWRTPFHCQFIA